MNENSFERIFKNFETKRCNIHPNGLEKNQLEQFIKFENELDIDRDQNIFRFTEKNFAKFIRLNIDVILCFNSINIDSKIKNALKLGIWYFHFPESNFSPGFFEVIYEKTYYNM